MNPPMHDKKAQLLDFIMNQPLHDDCVSMDCTDDCETISRLAVKPWSLTMNSRPRAPSRSMVRPRQSSMFRKYVRQRSSASASHGSGCSGRSAGSSRRSQSPRGASSWTCSPPRAVRNGRPAISPRGPARRPPPRPALPAPEPSGTGPGPGPPSHSRLHRRRRSSAGRSRRPRSTALTARPG